MARNFHKRPIQFDEDGLCGKLHQGMTPEICACLGRAAGCMFAGKKIGIACSGSLGAKALSAALCGGILAGGAHVWDFGACPGVVFDFCMAQDGVEFGFYLDGDMQMALRAVRRGGIAALREQELALEEKALCLEGEEFPCPGEYTAAPAFAQRYLISLLSMAAAPLTSMGVTVRSSSREVTGMIEQALSGLGCRPSPEITFQISSDGRSLSAHTAKTGYVFMERLHALCCLMEFMQGNDVAAEESAPRSLDRLASQYQRRVLRYSSFQEEDEGAVELAATQFYLRDAMMMTVRILSFLKENSVSLEQALALIPEFFLAKRFVAAASPMQRAAYEEKNGRVSIRPVKSGKGIWVLAEGENAEIAFELCDFYEAKLKRAALDTDNK